MPVSDETGQSFSNNFNANTRRGRAATKSGRVSSPPAAPNPAPAFGRRAIDRRCRASGTPAISRPAAGQGRSGTSGRNDFENPAPPKRDAVETASRRPRRKNRSRTLRCREMALGRGKAKRAHDTAPQLGDKGGAPISDPARSRWMSILAGSETGVPGQCQAYAWPKNNCRLSLPLRRHRRYWRCLLDGLSLSRHGESSSELFSDDFRPDVREQSVES